MIIADTTIIIDLWRGRSGAKDCLEKFKEELVCISMITVEEIYDGLGFTKQKKSETLYEEIKSQHEKILQEFQIIPITLDILKKAGLLRGELRAKGDLLDLADIIIMVTAQEIEAKCIITRNPKHFQNSSIPIESYTI